MSRPEPCGAGPDHARPEPGDGEPGTAPAGPTVLTVRDLEVEFAASSGKIAAVDGAGFSIRAGEIHGLVGESGSGKSATALALTGLLDPGARVSGQATLRSADGEERDLLSLTTRWDEIRGKKIGIVFQDPLASLSPYRRAVDQVAEAVGAHRQISGRRARERAFELLAETGLPEPEARGREYPHTLSGGMRQRVMIAIALAGEPDLLIADEPTASLDVTTQAAILDLIADLRGKHSMAVLLISHDIALVGEQAETVTVMRSGRILESGAVDEVLARPASEYTRSLIGAVPDIAKPRPARARAVAHRPPPGDRPLLEVTGLEKRFGSPGRRRAGKAAVTGLSLRLEPGTTLGLVGESGSGKTTTCRLIARLIRPTAGSIRLKGRELTGLSPKKLRPLRASMQMVFQDPYSSLNPRRTVGDSIAVPMTIHKTATGPDLSRRVDSLLERVGLAAADRGRFPHEFSGGQRQRIAIARAIGPGPELLLADEPVSALDVTIQAEILDLLRELREELGMAMIFVAHDLAVVRQVADRIAVMRNGQIAEQGDAERICTSPSSPYTRKLLEAVPRLRPAYRT